MIKGSAGVHARAREAPFDKYAKRDRHQRARSRARTYIYSYTHTYTHVIPSANTQTRGRIIPQPRVRPSSIDITRGLAFRGGTALGRRRRRRRRRVGDDFWRPRIP